MVWGLCLRRVLRGVVLAGVMNGAAALALADDFGASDTGPNKAYVITEISYFHFDTTEFNYAGLVGCTVAQCPSETVANPAITEGNTTSGIMPRVGFGFVLPAEHTPPWAGANLRTDLSWATFRSKVDNNLGMIIAPADALLEIFLVGTRESPLSGRPTLGIVTGGFADIRYTQSHVYDDVELTVRTDYPLASTVTATPSAGLTLTRHNQYYNITHFLVGFDPNDPVIDFASEAILDEALETTYYGGQAGLDLTWEPTPGLSLIVGGDFGLSYADSELKAEQKVVGSLNNPGDLAFFATAESRADQIVYNAAGRVGVQYDGGWWSVGLKGGAEFVSGIAKISNPTARTDYVLHDLQCCNDVVDVGYDSGVNFDGSVNFVFRFPVDKRIVSRPSGS